MSFDVLLVCGSLQQRSANRAALDVARVHLQGSPRARASYSRELGDVPPFNWDHRDHEVAALCELRDQIAASDGVIIAGPEYAGGIAGVLKNTLDWLVGSGELYSKPVAVISSGTTGGQFALAQMIRTLTWQGAHVVARLSIAAPKTKCNAAGELTDAETIDAITALADLLVETATMAPEQRIARVEQITADAGIEPGHVAPVVPKNLVRR
ncbi:MAG: NAD(P)H-dependent oxidoreductase [Myxococcales bacterium]|nr:NAD(P)H-dependent oxidoreductase [Myxococcales bacterium]